MNWLDKQQEKIFIITWTLIILTCLLVIFSSPVKAATGTTVLPYITTNNFNSISEEEVNTVLAKIQEQYPSADFSKIIVFKYGEGAWWTWSEYATLPFYKVICFSDDYTSNSTWSGPNLSSSTFSNFELYNSQYSIGVNLTGAKYYVYCHRQIGDFVDEINGQNNVQTFFGDNTLTTIQSPVNFTFNANYPVYCNFQLKTQDSVLDQGTIVSPGSSTPDLYHGHATEPINDPNNIIDDGSGNVLQRPSKPSPTPFTPQPFTPPSIDTSTLETLVESLIDVVEYGFNYIGGVISGAFSNLLSNFGAWVDYIVQSFSYGFNNVVKAIQNLATDFYNNMVSLFEPFYEFFSGVATFFNHLIEIGTVDGAFSLANIVTYLFIPDSAALYPIFVSHDEFNIIGISNHLFDEYRTLLSSVENINSLHYILIPSFTFHGQTIPQIRIDFSWFDDYKVYTDGIISAFLILGYVYFLFTRISGWLRGNQADVYVGDNSSNYHGSKIGF